MTISMTGGVVVVVEMLRMRAGPGKKLQRGAEEDGHVR
jgi:hypothetical protein